jgi:hypothetical protein
MELADDVADGAVLSRLNLYGLSDRPPRCITNRGGIKPDNLKI